MDGGKFTYLSPEGGGGIGFWVSAMIVIGLLDLGMGVFRLSLPVDWWVWFTAAGLSEGYNLFHGN